MISFCAFIKFIRPNVRGDFKNYFLTNFWRTKMRKLFALLTIVLFAGLAFAQTDADVDQSGTTNTADIWQSDAGPSNVNGTTYTKVLQNAGTTNDVMVKQLGRKSDIDLDQTAGTYNDGSIIQQGNYDNHFYIDQVAGGFNQTEIELGQDGGGDIHDNDYFVDQTATGNNQVTIYSRGNHIYSHNTFDVFQNASNGNNLAYIDADGDWRRNVSINSDQISQDNELQGIIRGQQVNVDIYQDGGVTNYGNFGVYGNNVVLNSYQSSLIGSNSLISYQENDCGATVNQTSTLGSNTANVNQVNP
jgi:hypothetical protein